MGIHLSNQKYYENFSLKKKKLIYLFIYSRINFISFISFCFWFVCQVLGFVCKVVLTHIFILFILFRFFAPSFICMHACMSQSKSIMKFQGLLFLFLFCFVLFCGKVVLITSSSSTSSLYVCVYGCAFVSFFFKVELITSSSSSSLYVCVYGCFFVFCFSKWSSSLLLLLLLLCMFVFMGVFLFFKVELITSSSSSSSSSLYVCVYGVFLCVFSKVELITSSLYVYVCFCVMGVAHFSLFRVGEREKEERERR